jgi:hypothetical protein
VTTALAWGLLGITLLLNLIATIQLLRPDFETRLQKAAQFSLIWLLPIVGAIIVMAVRAQSLHATRPDRSSDATGVSLYPGSDGDLEHRGNHEGSHWGGGHGE